jgi:hypothetical protein
VTSYDPEPLRKVGLGDHVRGLVERFLVGLAVLGRRYLAEQLGHLLVFLSPEHQGIG